MASLRKLNRRLRAWQRYTSRYPEQEPAEGHKRAALAVANEQDRRMPYEGGWYEDDEECWDDEECLGSCCRDDEDDAYDDEGYPWPPGTIVETGLAERGLL